MTHVGAKDVRIIVCNINSTIYCISLNFIYYITINMFILINTIDMEQRRS